MKVLVFFSFLLLPILLFPYFHKVQQIDCTNQYNECSGEVLSGLEKFKNKSVKETLLDLDKSLKENPRIKSYKIIYQPIADISVELIEEKASIAIKENGTSEFLLVSEDHQLITKGSETTLPKLYITKSEIKIDSPEVKFSQDLLIDLAKYYDINEAYLDDSSIVATYKNELRLTFPISGDIDILLGSLELLLFQLKQKLPDTKISSIDLRYKNPVVK